MNEKEKRALIGRAIREGKYLNITYRNQKGVENPFWICILDLDTEGNLTVDMFNVTKDEPLGCKKIFLASIQSAEILRFSHYEASPSLIQKVNDPTFITACGLEFFDNKLLNYYLECYTANIDPFIHKKHLIPGIDLDRLMADNPYALSSEQQKQLINEVYHKDYKSYHDYKLAISELSIDIKEKGKFVVAYRTLSYDPVRNILFLSKRVNFNPSFYINTVKHSLTYYLEMSIGDFEAEYNNDKQSAVELLEGRFLSAEMINTLPEVYVLGYAKTNIGEVYDRIETERKNGDLQIPMKAFFQNLSLLDTKNRTKPNIVLYDNNVNIDQLRTIYNALKYPITYVQGPPGTGKTQTILNIAVNCFTSNKTLLVSSNNNVPIDGIYKKLNLGHYNNKEIIFPVLRLGNTEVLVEAIDHIRKIYEFETKDIPKEELLTKLKERSKERNKKLDQRLEQLEERSACEQNLEIVFNLLPEAKNPRIEQEYNSIKSKLDELPRLVDEDLKGIFDVIKGNRELLQFFYYESLRFIKRLKTKEYGPLVEILYETDKKERVKAFKKWLFDDDNLELLLKVFPIILTTNLSCNRMGQNHKFDVLVMDEAGQCDISTSLLPISKCKNMVLIGDTNQLKPIVVFDEKTNDRLIQAYNINKDYDYYHNSILSLYRQIDNISKNILLSYHYRCGRRIINFSNQRYYEGKLNLEAINGPGNVELLQVDNKNEGPKNSFVEEVDAILEYVRAEKLADVFILTPFRNQERLLQAALQEAKSAGLIAGSVSCGTIHKVQGQENQTIILSTAISKSTNQRTYDWIKNNSQLINVAVTRAKDRLIIVTDKKAIDILSRKDDDLFELVEYVSNYGETKVAASGQNTFTIGFSNNSFFENEFYKTIQHFCSIANTRFERNVKLTKVFPAQTRNAMLNRLEFDGILYEGSKPKVVFEINGREHYLARNRIESDNRKMEFLKSENVQLIMVPNSYVKHYEFLGQLIRKIIGVSYQTEMFTS
jgi:hypothetical protein